MSQEKFDPIKEFTNIRDSISQTVEKSLRGVASVASVISVDVYQTQDEIVVYCSPLDGLRADSLEISMENNILTIEGETVDSLELPEDAQYLVRERKFGNFSRKITIDVAVKPQQARAKLKTGRLVITIPRVKTSTAQIIDIETTDE